MGFARDVAMIAAPNANDSMSDLQHTRLWKQLLASCRGSPPAAGHWEALGRDPARAAGHAVCGVSSRQLRSCIPDDLLPAHKAGILADHKEQQQDTAPGSCRAAHVPAPQPPRKLGEERCIRPDGNSGNRGEGGVTPSEYRGVSSVRGLSRRVHR